MRTSTRWTVVVLVIVVALGVALWRSLDDVAGPAGPPAATGDGDAPGGPREHRDADTPESLAAPRARAALPPCPAPDGGPGPRELDAVTVQCAADGTAVRLGPALAGRTTVLDLWAYWCGPCAQELPAMAEYQRRAGPTVTVLTVHQDENEAAALLRLADLGVRLTTVQDGRRLVAAALAVPNVMPSTVVLRSDGTVAAVLPRSFTSADEIAAAVDAAVDSATGAPG